VKVFARRVCS